MLRSEETDVADSTELQGLCFCAQPQGTEGLREGRAWKPSEVERECPSAEALMEATEETAWNKGFSRYYCPQTWCSFGECLKHHITTNGDRTEQSELLKPRQQGKDHPAPRLTLTEQVQPENLHLLMGLNPGSTMPCKRASPSLLSQLIMRAESLLLTKGHDFCLLDNGPKEPQIYTAPLLLSRNTPFACPSSISTLILLKCLKKGQEGD